MGITITDIIENYDTINLESMGYNLKNLELFEDENMTTDELKSQNVL